MSKGDLPYDKILIAVIAAIAFSSISSFLGWKLTLFLYAGAAVWMILG